jgi:hypothetical protein
MEPLLADSGKQYNHRLVRMSRWKAAGIHLLLSAVIAGTVVTFMLTVWYPWPLFEAAGGSTLILILVGVDVTLGPLITLIIFKTGKKGLRFDLTVIALLQLTALAYGIHTVYLARPVYLVFTLDRFEMVTTKDLDPKDLAKVTREEFKGMPLGRPRYVAAVFPSDPAEKARVMETSIVGKDLQMYPQYYVPYSEQAQSGLQHAKSVNSILEREREALERYLSASGRSQDSVKFLPLNATSVDGIVLLDAVSGMPLIILLINPW